MYRLADPAVPGADKIALVQDGTTTDAAALDAFAAALRDGGFAPVSFRAQDLRWSDAAPGAVLATITVTGRDAASPDGAEPARTGAFTFPMEFRTGPGGWQLTRDTAEMLLAFGNAR